MRRAEGTQRRVFALVAGLGVLFYALLRRPILTWGAIGDEATARLRCLAVAGADGTLASRRPAYTYDWIENLFGLGMHSVDRVLPEFQQPRIGDVVAFGSNRMRVERVEPARVIAWRSEDGNWAWTFVLAESGGRTRLISRNRFRLTPTNPRVG